MLLELSGLQYLHLTVQEPSILEQWGTFPEPAKDNDIAMNVSMNGCGMAIE